MFQINTTTKKFTEAASLNLGQLPTTDAKIDFRLNDGTNPVIAEGKTFEMTVGTVKGTLYKTDGDTVSFRYLKFDNTNVSATPAIVIKMEGVEILNDTVSLTYQTSGGGGASGAAWGQITGSLQDQSDLITALAAKISFPSGGSTGQFLQKTATGVQWATVQGGGDTPQPTPTITAPSSQSVEGTQGEELAASIATGVSASNGASVSFAVKQGSALPAGLALSAAGDVTGTPTAAGSTTTTVVLSAEGCDSVEMTVTLNIAESIQQGTITVTTNPTIQGVVGTAITSYNLASCVTVSNGQTPSFRWNDVYSPQPSWLTLTTSGMLSGTPTSIPSPTTGKVLVSAFKCSNEPNINITWDIINAGTITVGNQTIDGTVGNAVSLNLGSSTTVSNGQTPTFAVKSGNTLPAGIELSSAGVLSGTPTATSSATVVITITARGCPDKEVSITFNITEEQGGETPSDGWPTTITVSNVSFLDSSVTASDFEGTYARTGATSTVLGEAVPVWSNEKKLIYGVSLGMGTELPEPAIALYDGDGENDAFSSYIYRKKSETSWSSGDTGAVHGMTYKVTETGTSGGGSGSSDGFPKSFNVTSVPVASGYAQKPIGSYARTGETLVLGGVAYPVYSHTSDAVTGDQKTFYIHICSQMMGSTGVYWALSYEKPTSAEVEGYTHPRLGCVELKSGTYEPQGKNWGGADGTCEVEWTM